MPLPEAQAEAQTDGMKTDVLLENMLLDSDAEDEAANEPALTTATLTDMVADASLWQSEKKLADHLGLSVKELEEFLSGPAMQKFYKKLDKNSLAPARAAADSADATVPCIADLATITTALQEGEADGIQRYSNPSDETLESYTGVDHHALFLFKMRRRFADRKGGVLKDRGLSDAVINQRLCLILRRLIYDAAPSRK